MSINLKLPSKLRFLFDALRYKVAYGGRGSAKSWSFARALLIQGYAKPLRILCAREVQKSIKQSVHTLLVDQIQLLGLGQFYDVTETMIRGKNGTEISFTGLAQQTVESIKSFEGVDKVWIEEAHSVSKRSWDILIPTIRKPGSEIWITLNPYLDTDDTYVRFISNPPPKTIEEDGVERDYAKIIKINYNDNPWFSGELEQERKRCKENSPEDYDNIWEGKCKKAVDGAIYFNEVTDAQEQGRVIRVHYDPMLKVQIVFDMGWNDSMFISLVQRSASEIRIIECIEDSHKTLEYYSKMLKAKELNWGNVYMPHDAAQKDYKTGRSGIQVMEGFGWTVERVPMMSIESGIKLSRMTFPRVYFDKEKSGRLIDCLKRYSRLVNTVTGEPGTPKHDEYSHGADNFRYICIAAETMSNHNLTDNNMNIPASIGWMG